MDELFIQIVFGWPAIITSILLSIAGVWLKRATLLVMAGIVIIPFAYYLGGGFRWPILVLPFCHFGSAYAITRQKPRLARPLIMPLILTAMTLAYIVLSQR